MVIQSILKKIVRKKQPVTAQINTGFNPLPQAGTSNVLELVNQQGQTISWHGKLLDWTFGFILAILAICVVSFVTFIVDAYHFHAESYKEYTSTIQSLKDKNQTLKDDLMNQKMDSMQKEIDLMKRNPTPTSKGQSINYFPIPK